jgi:GxxExxY protein
MIRGRDGGSDWCMARNELIEERLTHSVIGAFYDVYNTLGYGFLEYLYKNALERELRARGHQVGREVYVIVTYKGEELGRQRIDLIVDERLIVEIKSTQDLHSAATRQIYNYLKATTIEVGLLFHFGPKPNFHRIIRRNPWRDPLDRPDSRSESSE